MKNIYGRIQKQGGKFYLLIGSRSFPVRGSVSKLSNGDLVIVSENLLSTGHIAASDLRVSKKSELTDMIQPITPDEMPLHKRLQERVFNLRTSRNHEIFAFRGKFVKLVCDVLDEQSFLLVHTPIILGKSTEGRTKTFKLQFGTKEAFLAMTKLIYLRYLTCADFEKVYDISPVFINAHHTSTDHVSEFYTIDWATTEKFGFNEHINFVNEVLAEVIRRMENFSKFDTIDFNTLSNLSKALGNDVVVPYEILLGKYLEKNPEDSEAIKQLHLPSRVIRFGHEEFGPCFWVAEFPEQFKQFYCHTFERNGKKFVSAAELWINGNKVVSSAYSTSDYQETIDRIRLLKLDKLNFSTYLKSIQAASSEAYLGSFYVERLIMALLDIKNMKEVLMFPRAIKGAVLDP